MAQGLTPLNKATRYRVRRWAERLTLLGLGAVAVLALSTILLAQPVDDDFNRAVDQRNAWFDYVYRYAYLHRMGRWAGVGLASFILPRIDPTRWYPLLLAGLHAAQLAALAVFWRLLLGRRAAGMRNAEDRGSGPLANTSHDTEYEHDQHWENSWVLTVGTYALLWALSPAPGETYTWFSGGVEYSLSLSLGVLLMGALVHGCRRLGEGSRGGWAWVAGGSAAAFVVAGMQEMAGVVLCLALLAGCVAAWRRAGGRVECETRSAGAREAGSITITIWNDDYEHEQEPEHEGHMRNKTVLAWALALGCGVAGTLVCILAPGNAERAATLKNGHNLFITIKSCVKLAALHVVPWALHPALWGATVALWLTPPAGARRPAWLRGPEVPWRWLLPAATLAATGVWLAGPSWAMGGTNGRALNATQTCFVLGWLASAVAWGAHWGWLRGVRGARRRRLRNAALGLMLGGVLLLGNTRPVAWHVGKAPAWRTQMMRQHEAARQARTAGVRDAVVPRVSAPLPPFFYSSGITADPRDWRNQSFAAFYGLRTVRTGNEKIPKE